MQSKFLMNGEETQRMVFKSIQMDDAIKWLPFFEDPASFQYWNGLRLSPQLECKNWYEKQFDRHASNRGGMNALVERATGELVGHAGILVQMVDDITELEIAYSLLPTFRQKGFATEAAKKCKEYAFENDLAPSLISIISLTNAPSANVAMKNGMRIEKQTNYNNNAVNIFRIGRSKYFEHKSLKT